MILGRTVFYRRAADEVIVAVIIAIKRFESDRAGCRIVDLCILPTDHPSCWGERKREVTQGFGIGQWQFPELLPQDAYGCPDYSKAEDAAH